MLPSRQVVAHHTAYVGAQAVPDAVYAISGGARVREVRVELSGALAHHSGVPQRRLITRVHG